MTQAISSTQYTIRNTQIQLKITDYKSERERAGHSARSLDAISATNWFYPIVDEHMHSTA